MSDVDLVLDLVQMRLFGLVAKPALAIRVVVPYLVGVE